MQFRSKQRGTRVKDRGKNGMSARAGSILFHILVLVPFFARLNLCSSSFLGLCLLWDQKPHGNACYACWAFVSRRRRRNLTSVTGVCEAAPISLMWQRTQRITGSAFRISFYPDWQINNYIFNRPVMARSQIQVHRWGPRTRILALFRRRTLPEFSIVCDVGKLLFTSCFHRGRKYVSVRARMSQETGFWI